MQEEALKTFYHSDDGHGNFGRNISMKSAEDVLKEVQNARQKFDSNISEVSRKHIQQQTISYFSVMEKEQECNSDLQRIRKHIDDKIRKIEEEIQIELATGKVQQPTKTTETVRAKAPVRSSLYTPRVQRQKEATKPAAENKRKSHNNKIVSNKIISKKQAQKVSLPPSTTTSATNKIEMACPTAFEEFIARHLVGCHPHRKHLREPPEKLNKGVVRSANTTINQSLKCDRHIQNNAVNRTFEQQRENLKRARDVQNNAANRTFEQRYENLNSTINKYENDCKENKENMIGNVYCETAVPLSSPCYNRELQLNEHTLQNRTSHSQPQNTSLGRSNGPNVAVFQVKSDSLLEETEMKKRLKKKVRERVRSKRQLNVQALPSVDIDTTDPSTCSTETPHRNNDKLASVNHARNYASPAPNEEKESSGYDFQDYIAVQDTSQTKADESPHESEVINEADESVNESPISLSGGKNTSPHSPKENGPMFPPEQRKTADKAIPPRTVTNHIQQHTQDWLEQELLARIIAQSNDNNQSPVYEEDESDVSQNSPDLSLDTGGFHMILDAGTPSIDNDQLNQILKDVLLEKLKNMLGVRNNRSPTPPPQTSHDQSAINVSNHVMFATPPLTPPPSKATPLSMLETPERSSSELAEQSVDGGDEDVVPVKISPRPVSPHAASQHHSIATPDASTNDLTPSLHHTPPHTPQITPSSSQHSQHGDENVVKTPELSQHSLSLEIFEQEDFENTIPSESAAREQSPVKEQPPLIITAPPQNTPTPPTQAPSLRNDAPATPEVSDTLHTSSVGVSTYDGISMGEHLNPSCAELHEGVSEGEMAGLPHLQLTAVMEDLPFDYLPNQSKDMKMIIDDLIMSDKSKASDEHRNMPGQSALASQYFEQDTLNAHSYGGNPKSAGEISQSTLKKIVHDDEEKSALSNDAPLLSVGELADTRDQQFTVSRDQQFIASRDHNTAPFPRVISVQKAEVTRSNFFTQDEKSQTNSERPDNNNNNNNNATFSSEGEVLSRAFKQNIDVTYENDVISDNSTEAELSVYDLSEVDTM